MTGTPFPTGSPCLNVADLGVLAATEGWELPRLSARRSSRALLRRSPASGRRRRSASRSQRQWMVCSGPSHSPFARLSRHATLAPEAVCPVAHQSVAEARGGLHIVEGSLWEAIPKYLRRLSKSMKRVIGRELPITAAPVKFSSWIGGDRDGNPNVTHKARPILSARIRRA